MNTGPRKSWKRYLPSHVNNPVKLVWRLLVEDNPAARSALMMAIGGLVLVPVDLILSVFERKVTQQASDPDKPIILVCGPPRSGTTLVAQYLIDMLQVGYINNLTSLFPRAPLTANAIFGRWLRPKPTDYRAYYGKTRSLSGANDALYIWDRWLGHDRTETPADLSIKAKRDMRHFFGALQERKRLPIVNKVNRLNTCAHLVAETLPQAIFVYLRREPRFLAQSLYIARRDIVGDMARPYGVSHPNRVLADPVEDVCRQVEFYEEMLKIQKGKIGGDRFIELDYEDFCADPEQLLSELKQRLPQIENQERVPMRAPTFSVSRKRRLDDAISRQFEQRLGKFDTTACMAQ